MDQESHLQDAKVLAHHHQTSVPTPNAGNAR